MMIALVAMFVMTMSANAQSVNDSKLTFDRLSSYLELTASQIEPVKTAMAQFATSMEAYSQLQPALQDTQAWQKIEARHKATMKKVLSEKQYRKYEQMLDLTAKNTADRIADRQTATR